MYWSVLGLVNKSAERLNCVSLSIAVIDAVRCVLLLVTISPTFTLVLNTPVLSTSLLVANPVTPPSNLLYPFMYSSIICIYRMLLIVSKAKSTSIV